MKLIAYFFILVVFTSFSKTLLLQKALPELIVQSNSIVLGELKAMTDTSLTFQALEIIKGKTEVSITVYKQQGKPADIGKLQGNKVGQTELLFLDYNEEDKLYEFYAGGGTAELPVRDSLIYVYSHIWYNKKNRERYPVQEVFLDDNTIEAKAYSKKEFCLAIKDYLSDRLWIVKRLLKEPDIKYTLEYKSPQKEDVILKNKALLRFCQKSEAHLRLIYELTDNPATNLLMGYKSYW